MMKNRKEEKKTSHQTADFEIASCQLGLLFFTSHYVAGSFWRWLFVSLCDWNNNDGGLVFLLFAERKTCSALTLTPTQTRPHFQDTSEVHFTFVLILFNSLGISMLSCKVTVSGEWYCGCIVIVEE